MSQDKSTQGPSAHSAAQCMCYCKCAGCIAVRTSWKKCDCATCLAFGFWGYDERNPCENMPENHECILTCQCHSCLVIKRKAQECDCLGCAVLQ